MSDDAPRKLNRQFQCREYLWEGFEQLSGELECSVEYLLNEAMRQYLRSQGRVIGPPSRNKSPPATGAWMPASKAGELTPAPRTPPVPPRMEPTPVTQGGAPPRKPALPPLPPRPVAAVPRGQLPPLPPAIVAPAVGPEMPLGNGLKPQVTPARKGLPTLHGHEAPAAPGASTLYALTNDQEVAVEKDEFFIGRGQKYCDLVLRNGNVSRQHARVYREDGIWWIADNGSTNGVLFQGERIERRPIVEGEVFTICEHEIRFEYR